MENIMDKQVVIADIHASGRQVEELASSLSEQQLNTVPYPKSWTAAQLLRHLIKSETLMTGALRTPAQPATRDPALRVPELRDIFLNTESRLSSPDRIIPEPGPYTKSGILAEWRDALGAFDAAATAAPATDLVEGLPLGPITKLEIVHFVLVHTQRHLSQMKRIVAALRNPEK